MASEPIIETTINIEKLFCFNQGHPDFQRPGLSNYDHMERYCNDFSIILGIWSVMSYSCHIFLVLFLPLSKEVYYSTEGKFISRIFCVSIYESTI